VAVFQLVKEKQTVEYTLGKFREDTAMIHVSPGLEEAEALLCRLGHCAPDTPKP
jgi:hypothetical protein